MSCYVLRRLPAHTLKLLDLKASFTASHSTSEIDSDQICHRCFSCVVAHEKMAVFSCAGEYKLHEFIDFPSSWVFFRVR